MFDAIFVDEAQDWPQGEADLLCAIYGSNRIALADGIAQFIRGLPTRWHLASHDSGAERIYQKKSLRMKANLARFANAMARQGDFKWTLDINQQAPGGVVIVMEGDYATRTELQKELLGYAKAMGNEQVDFLHCVPSSAIVDVAGKRSSRLAMAFRASGCCVWDGVEETTRRDYPRSITEYRIVQYESCRGLEGWVTVLDGVDEFWQRKFEQQKLETLRDGNVASDSDAVCLETAWRWMIIALTRPIDTLVLTVRDRKSLFARAIDSVATSLGDIIEFR